MQVASRRVVTQSTANPGHGLGRRHGRRAGCNGMAVGSSADHSQCRGPCGNKWLIQCWPSGHSRRTGARTLCRESPARRTALRGQCSTSTRSQVIPWRKSTPHPFHAAKNGFKRRCSLRRPKRSDWQAWRSRLLWEGPECGTMRSITPTQKQCTKFARQLTSLRGSERIGCLEGLDRYLSTHG